MKKYTRVLFLVLATVLFGALLTSNASAQQHIFVKMDGIDGESRDKNHDKWCDALSLAFSMHHPRGGATGSTRRRGDVIFDDVMITKKMDKASPKLNESCAIGKVFPRVKIDYVVKTKGGRAIVAQYELKNVSVTSVSLTASAGKAPPVEEVSLNFEEIKYSYTERDQTGKSKGNVEFSWKVEEGER